MESLLNPLIKWGEKFRGFLALAAFVLVIFLAAVIYLFAQGSFSQVLSNFGKLNGDQFFIFVLSVLILLFFFVVFLLFLGYKSIRPSQGREPQSEFYVRVFDAKTKQRLASAKVLITPEGDRTRSDQTDWKGEAQFTFPSTYKGRKCGIEASREDYENASIELKLGTKPEARLDLVPKDKSLVAKDLPGDEDIQDYNQKAWDLNEQGKYQEALEMSNQAIKTYHGIALGWAYNYRCWALAGLGRYEEALKANAKASELTPKHVALTYNLRSWIFNEQERFEDALEASKQAIQCASTTDDSGAQGWAYNNRCWALAGLGRYREALEANDEALKLTPNDSLTHNLRSWIFNETGRYQEALHESESAIRYANAHYDRGAQKWAQKNKNEALTGINRDLN